jgi:agmatine deiminase
MRVTIILLTILITSCSSNETKNERFVFPPEWEQHEAVWTDFASEWTIIPNQEAKLKIIATLSKYVKTNVVFDSDSLKEIAVNKLSGLPAANLSNINFIKSTSPMNWIRDPGPIFVTNGDQLKVKDFKWNCYGKAYDCESDFRGKVNDELAKGMSVVLDTMEIYLEGGGIEVSNNSILAYRAMADQRNPDKSLEEITKVLLEAFGKEQIIWLDEFPLIDKPLNKVANYFGEGANGHIDVTTRFLNDSTILATTIAEADKGKSELLREDYRILNNNLRQLRQAKRPNGKPYQIITIEAPDYTLFEYETTMADYYFYSLPEDIREKFNIGDTIKYVPALEYANFLVTNGAVLVSNYWKEGMPETERKKDENILNILKQHFPKRDIIPMDVLPINWGGGGIHCRTQQQPKLN